jgi:hypothetical protein
MIHVPKLGAAMPPGIKCKELTITLDELEIKIIRIFNSDRDVGCKLTLADLLDGEYAEHLKPMDSSQKLRFLTKLERLGYFE